jgi:ABC-type transport system involved in cytochrome bd biosynthesis fused ATPase/permease subunit
MARNFRFLWGLSPTKTKILFAQVVLFGCLSIVFELLAAGTFSILASSSLGGKSSNQGILDAIFPFSIDFKFLLLLFIFFFILKLVFQFIELKIKNFCASSWFNQLLSRDFILGDELESVEKAHKFNHQILYPSMLIISELAFLMMFIPFLLLTTGLYGASIILFLFVLILPVAKLNLNHLRSVAFERHKANRHLQDSLYSQKRLHEDFNYDLETREEIRLSAQRVNRFDHKYVTLGAMPRFLIEIAFMIVVIILLFLANEFISQKDKIYVFAVLGYAFFRIIPSLSRVAIARQQISSHDFLLTEFEGTLGLNHQQIQTIDLADHKWVSVLEPSLYSNIRIFAGKWTLIKGTTGIGKTRLLKFLSGISSENYVLKNASGDEFSRHNWRPISVFVSQTPFLKGKSLQEMANYSPSFGEKSESRFDEFCDMCVIPLTMRRVELDYLQLSGGEKKQISLLRALLVGKKFMLLDEITAGMDKDLAVKILSQMHESLENYTVVMTTHEDTFDHFFDHIYTIK